MTRILAKVKGTLAKGIDKLMLTYLKTAITQLEKKHEQIADLDREIMELIEDSSKLEDTIMDSKEVLDLIMENINVLNEWDYFRGQLRPLLLCHHTRVQMRIHLMID